MRPPPAMHKKTRTEKTAYIFEKALSADPRRLPPPFVRPPIPGAWSRGRRGRSVGRRGTDRASNGGRGGRKGKDRGQHEDPIECTKAWLSPHLSQHADSRIVGNVGSILGAGGGCAATGSWATVLSAGPSDCADSGSALPRAHRVPRGLKKNQNGRIPLLLCRRSRSRPNFGNTEIRLVVRRWTETIRVYMPANGEIMGWWGGRV